VKSYLDCDELRQISEEWGTQWADALIEHPRWPSCDQGAAICAAKVIVRKAIAGIAAILDESDDFKPHLPMMSAVIWRAFRSSMPDYGRLA
jgi:hypothetical protein